MFGTVLSTVTGLFESRFLRNSFFLAFAFVVLSVVIVGAGQGELSEWISTVGSWSVTEQLLAAAALVGVVWFLAAILDSQTRAITQVFEGYWPAALEHLAKPRKARHAATLDELRKAARMDAVYGRYPLSSKKVLPTRLGNILRASEEYSGDRYGANAALIWPRLYPLLPAALITAVGQSRAALEFLLVLSALATVFTALSAIYLLAVTAPIALYLACVVGGCAVATTAYRASLAAAMLYAEVVRGAFDLHRFEVLAGMHLPLPAEATTERALWAQVERLLLQNEPLRVRYAHPAPKA